ncbi:MAG: ABC transporter ATP-binding protein, partial [Opitutaceae bacterium]|nr:ABC transporter ATP-binding protein [Cytophagales bacterium]
TYHLHSETGEPLFSFSNASANMNLAKGLNKIKCTFPQNFLMAGTYYLSFFFIRDKAIAEFVEKDIMSFTISDSERELGTYMGKEPGFIKPKFLWENNI